MSDAYAQKLEDHATVISWMFIVEMTVKVLGLGAHLPAYRPWPLTPPSYRPWPLGVAGHVASPALHS